MLTSHTHTHAYILTRMVVHSGALTKAHILMIHNLPWVRRKWGSTLGLTSHSPSRSETPNIIELGGINSLQQAHPDLVRARR